MGRNQRDFDREIESHLELETERLIAEGMAPTEARAAARRAFGNVGQAKERFFERGRIRWLDQLLRDVGYSLRGLAARPGFTLAAIITLALGIGLNSALFSLMYWVAARPFPVRDAHRIVNVYQNVQNGGGRTTTGPWTWVSFPEYRRYRDGSRSFDELAAYRGVDLVFGGDRPRPVQGSLVSCNYFRALQVVIPLGRGLADDDCRVAGGAPVAVMAAQLWRNEFGSDPNLVGKQLTVNGVTAVVIGVAEPGFGGIDWRPADLWFPITMQPTLTHRSNETLERERSSWLTMVGRLRAGVSRQSAEAELAVVGQRAAAGDSGRRVQVFVPKGSLLNEPGLRRQGAAIGIGILAVSALVILLACTNLMNLLLARGLAKRREIAIRLSLGASRGRLIAQLMVESLLLAIMGGGLGIVLVYRLPNVILATAPTYFGRPDVSPDLAVFGYAAVVAAVTALLFGLAPALQSTKIDLASSIKLADVGSGRSQASWLRKFVVAAQVAGSALLVATAGLFLRALGHAGDIELGYRTSGVIAITIGTDDLGYDQAKTRAIYDQVVDRLRALPGVEAVALARMLPLSGRMTSDVESADGSKAVWAAFNDVSPEYFETLGIPIVEGRVFRREDAGDGDGDRPVVVSERAARELWPGMNPIGQRIRLGNVDGRPARALAVTGVAKDVSNHGIGEPDQPFIYQPVDPARPAGRRLIVTVAPAASAAVLTSAAALVREADPSVLVEIARFEDLIEASLAPARLAARFATALGALATILAMVGIYGIVSYGVTQRTREFGVRIALGASGPEITRLALGQGLLLVASGLAVGVVLAVGAARLLRGLLYGLGALDPVALGGMVVVIGVTAGLAILVPARRATTINPIDSLRAD